MAGTLTLHGLDVLDARGWSFDDGMALEVFTVVPLFDRTVKWDAVTSDVRRALAGELELEARVTDRARAYGLRRVRAARPEQTSVRIDDNASAVATVIDVRAADRIGTLYRITRVLAECGLDVRHAKISSIGHEVVDAFYVVDGDGRKLTWQQGAQVRDAILDELSRH